MVVVALHVRLAKDCIYGFALVIPLLNNLLNRFLLSILGFLNLLFTTNVDFANASNPQNFNFLFAFFLICEVLRFAYFLDRFLFRGILFQAVAA